MNGFDQPQKMPEEIRVRKFQFLGEQDGPPERLLKDKLADLFRPDAGVQAAYLARVRYGDEEEVNVALAVRAVKPETRLVQEVGGIFASLFRTDAHLDTVFLTPEQEFQLAKVCKPFFEKRKPPP